MATTTKPRRAPRSTAAVITRDDVQQAIWFLTGWQGSAAAVDRLLLVIDEYALAHGAVLSDGAFAAGRKRVVHAEPKESVAFDHILREDKRLRCNSCGVFKPLGHMRTDLRRTDGVRTTCTDCLGRPPKPEFRGQRVYRIRTQEGWAEARRVRAGITLMKE